MKSSTNVSANGYTPRSAELRITTKRTSGNKTTTNDKESQKRSQMDREELAISTLIIKALNHDVRESILDLLKDYSQMSVSDISFKLRLERSVTSQHLAVLRRVGAVLTVRNGKYVYYSINESRLNDLLFRISFLSRLQPEGLCTSCKDMVNTPSI